MQLGYIGLGKMGKNMVLHLLEKGHEIIGYNRNTAPYAEIEAAGGTTAETVKELVAQLAAPRLVWLMVPWQAVDDVLKELVPLLIEGDTVIDGGNSPYEESIRRAKELAAQGVHFLDCGVSGGPGGARSGACCMIGGEHKIYQQFEQLFKDISVPDGYGYMGKSGAGHFVKMVHNGIEYGMLQAIGEGFAVMKKSTFDLNLSEVARVYGHGSVITSRLIDWLQSAYEQYGEDLQDISGEVSHSGEGQWTVEVAKKLGVPVNVIAYALQFRKDSQGNPSYTGQVISALRNQFGGHEVSKK